MILALFILFGDPKMKRHADTWLAMTMADLAILMALHLMLTF